MDVELHRNWQSYVAFSIIASYEVMFDTIIDLNRRKHFPVSVSSPFSMSLRASHIHFPGSKKTNRLKFPFLLLVMVTDRGRSKNWATRSSPHLPSTALASGVIAEWPYRPSGPTASVHPAAAFGHSATTCFGLNQSTASERQMWPT